MKLKAKPDSKSVTFKALLRSVLLGGVSTLAMGAFAPPSFAQDAEDADTIVVTGIRGSLQRSMDIKRNATGVVDAISAEDIGKMPDTNLAESLQRITGVSIDRVNGEGSRVTARGFGSGFNMVTLNGRTMPTADTVVVGSGADGEFNSFTSRAFDFSNLASEGVTGLEVHKTGNATIPSGGIGATINVRTFRPLDNPGTQGTIGVKGVFDTSVENGEEITPELSGLFSWSDPSEMFGVSLFGSWQQRDSGAVGAQGNNWNLDRGAQFLDPNNGRVRADNPNTPANEATVLTNPPSAQQLVAFPNNSDYFFSEVTRERLNGQLVVQFRPADNLTLTADAYFAQNQTEEQRSTQGNWFNRPFGEVIFNGDPIVSTTVFLAETLSAPKDIAWGQELRATEDTVQSFGFNADWDVSDRLTLSFDAHTSESESGPNAPGGVSSYVQGTGAAVIASHSLDLRSGFPVQRFTISDVNQNNNGVLDIGDVSSSVGRTATHLQHHEIDQFRFDVDFDLGSGMSVAAGVDYRTSSMTQSRLITAQIMGDWGVAQPGDIEANAPGALEQYCLSCLYDDFEPGDAEIAFRGNAATLYNALSPYYLGLGNPVQTWNDDFNQVDEDMTALYAQFSWDGEISGRPASLVAGVRYEETDVSAASILSIPQAVVWNADNDFSLQFTGVTEPVEDEASYSHTLPSIDFQMEIVDDVIARASFSKTMARADYGQLFVADSAGTPPRATTLGGLAPGSSGNTGLVPLESTNIDISLEAYYGDASYVSIGLFNKEVSNFVGTGQTTRNLFGLTDPSSGAAGTRSGVASALLATIPDAIRNDVNLFVMTAMVDNPADYPDPVQTFLDNSTDGVLDQTFADQIFIDYDIISDGTDPLFQHQVTRPINNREANIHGVEFAIQHFFGDTGFGAAANYTFVDGDVAIDVGADPSVDQFALQGLSDTANVTLIYEDFGWSVRLAYNWRDEFLNRTNVGAGGVRNPEFVGSYEQFDLNVSYDVTPNLVVSFEGINLTGENLRTFGRDRTQYWFIQELDPRYLFGARYRFN